jgi:hypothetical protein
VDAAQAYFGENSDPDASAVGQQSGSADSTVCCQICRIQSWSTRLGTESAVRVAAAGEPRLTLNQKLARFDPERHGGEAMATVRAGKEVL